MSQLHPGVPARSAADDVPYEDKRADFPIEQLEKRVRELPKRKEIVAYCRGPFCLMSFEAVQLLRKKGLKARRLANGMPEWRIAGLPVET